MSMMIVNSGCQSLPPPKTYTSYDTFNSDKATYLYAGVCKTSTSSVVSGTNNTASALNAFNSVEGSVTNSSSAQSFSYVWNNDLQIGSPYFADVTALQTALMKDGLYSGEITGGFYSQTFVAVQAFQQKYGIEATGFVGSITRAKLNALY